MEFVDNGTPTFNIQVPRTMPTAVYNVNDMQSIANMPKFDRIAINKARWKRQKKNAIRLKNRSS